MRFKNQKVNEDKIPPITNSTKKIIESFSSYTNEIIRKTSKEDRNQFDTAD